MLNQNTLHISVRKVGMCSLFVRSVCAQISMCFIRSVCVCSEDQHVCVQKISMCVFIRSVALFITTMVD